MINSVEYDSQCRDAILALRKLLLDCHFDLLVRELKLPALYFQEPGFIYYGHSLEANLARLGSKYALLIKLFCLNHALPIDEVADQLLPRAVINDLIGL